MKIAPIFRHLFGRSPDIPPEAEKDLETMAYIHPFWNRPQPDIAQGVRMGSGGAERSEAPSAKVLGKRPIAVAGASAAGASGS